MRRCEDKKMWRGADVKMRRCEEEQMWRWADVKMSRCEDEQMWRWADVEMRRCEDEKIRRGEDVKRSRCEDEQMWRWADVKMSRCEDEKVWEKVLRWEGVKMRRWDTDPHYWKNPALRRSREKMEPPASTRWGQIATNIPLKNASGQRWKTHKIQISRKWWGPGPPFPRGNSKGDIQIIATAGLKHRHLSMSRGSTLGTFG